MDLQLLILEKLFTAFSGIVVELVKSSNIEENTKRIISDNIASISSIFLTINNQTTTNEPIQNPPPEERPLRFGRTRITGNEIETGNTKARKNQPAPREPTNVGNANPGTSSSSDLTANIPEFELCAIAPEKKVFLSNFPTSTTVAEIQAHIKKKIPEINLSDVEVKKTETKSERPSYSSFVINAWNNMQLFNVLVDTKFWPIHSVVHEYNNSRKRSNFHHNHRRPRRT